MAKKQASWFKRGEDGWKEHKRVRAATEARMASRRSPRFWLPKGEEVKVTFLDHPDFWVYEHRLKIGQSYNNFFTCLAQLVDSSGVSQHCPLCTEADNRASYVLVGTIINHGSYVNRDGKEIKNYKQLVVFPPSAVEMLQRRIKRAKGDLRYCTFNVARGHGTKEPGVGMDWEFMGRVKPEGLIKFMPDDFSGGKQEYLKPFDYEAEFEPLSEAELYAAIGIDPPGGTDASDDDDDETEEDDFPWDEDNDEASDEEDTEPAEEDDEEEPAPEPEKPKKKDKKKGKKTSDESPAPARDVTDLL